MTPLDLPHTLKFNRSMEGISKLLFKTVGTKKIDLGGVKQNRSDSLRKTFVCILTGREDEGCISVQEVLKINLNFSLSEMVRKGTSA